VEARLRALEKAVSDERYARQLLQDELFVLTGELEALMASRPGDAAADGVASLANADNAPSAGRRRRGSAGRAERLVAAGFEAGQAEWILQRESQLQMEALQAWYEAERTGDATNYFQGRSATSEALRSELGEAEYERYLAASDRPTSVAVATVLESSPAQRAGLQPGDEIVSYDGKRIFSMSDLTRQTLEGQAGEQVVIDFRRDGVSMQVALPRGPIGIAGGERFSR
jgi:PDZ domain